MVKYLVTKVDGSLCLHPVGANVMSTEFFTSNEAHDPSRQGLTDSGTLTSPPGRIVCCCVKDVEAVTLSLGSGGFCLAWL